MNEHSHRSVTGGFPARFTFPDAKI